MARSSIWPGSISTRTWSSHGTARHRVSGFRTGTRSRRIARGSRSATPPARPSRRTCPGTSSMSRRSHGRRSWAARPLPKIFRLTKGGKLIEGIFAGETINTPSMLAVEDYLLALDWAQAIGGLPELMARADRNAQAIFDFCAARDWIDNLAADPATRSNTSVCLKFTDDRIADGAAFAKAVAKRLEAEGVALDVGGYRDAPPGLRIWCGATVETSDIEAMLPWLDWAFHMEIEGQASAA